MKNNDVVLNNYTISVQENIRNFKQAMIAFDYNQLLGLIS